MDRAHIGCRCYTNLEDKIPLKGTLRAVFSVFKVLCGFWSPSFLHFRDELALINSICRDFKLSLP